MVGLAEGAAEKTMVRSHKGIRGAFVVETTGDGKSGLAVQLEGSDFETVWQLKEGGVDGSLNLNKVSSCFVFSMCLIWGLGGDAGNLAFAVAGFEGKAQRS